jgi:hypothetical protein
MKATEQPSNDSIDIDAYGPNAETIFNVSAEEA